MSIILGFTIVLMALLLVYIVYRLFLRRKLFILISLALQIMALTIAIMCFRGNVDTTNMIESFYILCGIAIPSGYFVYDYTRMMKKIREQGVFQGFVEHEERFADDLKDLNLNKKYINTIIKERQVPELIKDLNINKEDIIKNIKKNLTQAQLFINNKDYENAYDIYNTLTKLIKNCPSLFYNHGNICYNLGHYSEAVNSYKKVLDLNEKLIKDINSPQEVFSIAKNKKDNGSDLADAPKSETDLHYEEFMVYFNLGNTLFKINKYQQAIDSYKKALEMNPNMEEANENIARAMLAMDKIDEAIEYYRKIVVNDNNNFRVHYILGTLFTEIKKYDFAEIEINECIKLKSTFAEAYDELGKILSKKEEFKLAADAYKKYSKYNPQDYKGVYNIAMSLYRSGSKADAIEYFRKVIVMNADNHKAYFNMAVAFDEIENQDEAIIAFKKVIEIKPEFIEAYNNLGIILSTQGRYLEALDVYIRGLKKNPEEASLYFNMGITLSDMARYADAIDAYKNALEINPEEHIIYYHMAIALTEMKKYSEAVEAYKIALKVKPADSELFYNIATVYSILKKHDIAIDNLRRAIELNDEFKIDAKTNRAFDGLRSKGEFKELVS